MPNEPNRDEKVMIDECFETAIKGLFDVLWKVWQTAQGSDDAQRAAVVHFVAGVKTARAVRDAAKAALS